MRPLIFTVICEAAADFRTATSLAERVIRDGEGWIEAGQAHHFFRWQGRDLNSPSWLWREIGVRSAKRVLGLLTRLNSEREEACWAQTPLATIRGRGEPSGVAAYLEEVAERLVPLFTGRPAGSASPVESRQGHPEK